MEEPAPRNEPEMSGKTEGGSLDDSSPEEPPVEFKEGQDTTESGSTVKLEEGQKDSQESMEDGQSRQSGPGDQQVGQGEESTGPVVEAGEEQPASIEEFIVLSEEENDETPSSKTIDVLPASDDVKVQKVKDVIAEELRFLLVINLVRNVARYLRIANYATADNATLLVKQESALFAVLKLCDSFALVMQNVQSGANNILEKLKIAYLYLMDGFPDFAMTDIEAISKDVASMKSVVDKMQNVVTSNRDSVAALVEEVRGHEERKQPDQLRQPVRKRKAKPQQSSAVDKSKQSTTSLSEALVAYVGAVRVWLSSFAWKNEKTFQDFIACLDTWIRSGVQTAASYGKGIVPLLKELLGTASVLALDLFTGAFVKFYRFVSWIVSLVLSLVAWILGYTLVTTVCVALITCAWNFVFFFPNLVKRLCIDYPIFLLKTGAGTLIKGSTFYYIVLNIPYTLTKFLHLEPVVAYVVSGLLLPILQSLKAKIPDFPQGQTVAEWVVGKVAQEDPIWNVREEGGYVIVDEPLDEEPDKAEPFSDSSRSRVVESSRPMGEMNSSRPAGMKGTSAGEVDSVEGSSTDENTPENELRLRRPVQESLPRPDSEDDGAGPSTVLQEEGRKGPADVPTVHWSKEHRGADGATLSTLTCIVGASKFTYEWLRYNVIPALCASVVFCYVWTTMVCSSVIPFLQFATASTMSGVISVTQGIVPVIVLLSVELKGLIQSISVFIFVNTVKFVLFVPNLCKSVFLDYPIYVLSTGATALMQETRYRVVLYYPKKLVTKFQLDGLVTKITMSALPLLQRLRESLPVMPEGGVIAGRFLRTLGWKEESDAPKSVDTESDDDEESDLEEDGTPDESTLRYQLIRRILGEVILPLETIGDILGSSGKMVDTWYNECKDIVEPSMGRGVNMAEGLSEEEKKKYWASAMFQQEVVGYYQRWRALEVYAGENRRRLRELRATVEKYYTENPYPREAVRECWTLAGEERNENILEVVRVHTQVVTEGRGNPIVDIM